MSCVKLPESTHTQEGLDSVLKKWFIALDLCQQVYADERTILQQDCDMLGFGTFI